jgi:hypothetical protein
LPGGRKECCELRIFVLLLNDSKSVWKKKRKKKASIMGDSIAGIIAF